jgi:prepilin-type N-terminal cleavage/methylation domain-containing protein
LIGILVFLSFYAAKKMKVKPGQSGLTLTEMVVVVSIIAVFAVLGVPAIRAFIRSVESEGGARAMISSALSTARAMAAKEHHYAGIRFQNKYQPGGNGCQYMIFIVNDPNLVDAAAVAWGSKETDGFRAIDGLQPIKLPDSVGVMEVVSSDGEIDDNPSGELIDKTTFSVVFSKSGKLVIHKVPVLRKDVYDTIFNDPTSQMKPMFEDDYNDAAPFKQESSRNSFIIYDKTIFEKLDPSSRYTDYLKNLEVVFINPYTGTMINR